MKKRKIDNKVRISKSYSHLQGYAISTRKMLGESFYDSLGDKIMTIKLRDWKEMCLPIYSGCIWSLVPGITAIVAKDKDGNILNGWPFRYSY